MVTIEKLNTLNDLEMSIYHYVEAHRDEVVKLKLKDIAEVIHVSPSMITRTAQKIGYDGFVEWKTAIKMENKNHLHHKENKLNYILDYFQKVDNDEFNQSIHQATQIIAQSKEVMFWGVGISGAIAKAGAYLFNRKGKRSVVCDDFSMRVHGMYNHHDCAIVLSVSGETDEMIQRIMLLKRCGVQVIIITNSASSSGAKMADLAICYYVPSSRNEDFYSSVTQVPVIYILESLADTLEEYGII